MCLASRQTSSYRGDQPQCVQADAEECHCCVYSLLNKVMKARLLSTFKYISICKQKLASLGLTVEYVLSFKSVIIDSVASAATPGPMELGGRVAKRPPLLWCSGNRHYRLINLIYT